MVRVPIDPELEELLNSTDPNAVKEYLEREVGRELAKAIYANLQDEIEKIMHGDGGYYNTPSPVGILLDDNSMHPSMWVSRPKPKNSYERMMSRRKGKRRLSWLVIFMIKHV